MAKLLSKNTQQRLHYNTSRIYKTHVQIQKKKTFLKPKFRHEVKKIEETNLTKKRAIKKNVQRAMRE
jgi:hypothetical protein